MYRTLAGVMKDLGRRTNYERMTRRPKKSRVFNLDRMRALMEALGHPENSFRSIHVGGTKGKGSTTHMLEAILAAGGKKTGAFTSPHLVHLLERIRIDGKPASEKSFLRAMNRMKKDLDRIRPTFFEIMNAAAFLVFRQEKVEWAVVEVGLGGRLDSTNVLTPEISVLTTIDLDHTDVLGSTIGKIAADKAGIIKPGAPVFTSVRKREAIAPIRKRARKCGVPLRRLGREIRVEGATRSSSGVLQFRVRLDGEPALRMRLPLLGEHQAENAAVATAVARHVGISRASIGKALAGIRLPGRIEVVRRKPEIVVDVGHNPAAMRALVRALSPPGGKSWLVFGAARDKDWEEMLRILAPHVDAGFMTRPDNPRACSPSLLAAASRFPVECVQSVADAFVLARSRAAKQDRILVTGSFSVAGEVLEELKRS